MLSEKIKIMTERGDEVEASAPVVISASRSTDIPAFYAEWFFDRLSKGYCLWYNPFNRRPTYVSFRNCRVIVFWSKNPAPLMPYLSRLDELGINYYFQFTLNDYEHEGFEPGLPSLDSRVETFRALARRIGTQRVVWRFDPLIVTSSLDVAGLLGRISRVGELLKGYTGKMVFSFVDIASYGRIRRNLMSVADSFLDNEPLQGELSDDMQVCLAEGLAQLRRRWHEEGWPVEMATCAESVDLSRFGIIHNSCIDREMMMDVFSDDRELVHYLDYGKLPEADLFGGTLSVLLASHRFKDKGQRRDCGCMISKDIGMYDTCPHGCIYCYANRSHAAALRNFRSHSSDSESIVAGRI
ncbi:DUF1848 domain-containing protein [uncultured Muribaculum sp.]|uniref:DUF1848 domain-containing protein n=1 Tax=uncultured Muribaculum sp. TaxID=1918613 RepID=UPI0026000A5C|nr:DUF1848 domain-containing protein [uncultured Muribaculum sp.]